MNYDGIIVNGDSYSARYADTLTYADFLGRALNVPVENVAQVGSSNDRIVRSTINAIDQFKFSNPLIVIGWSFLRRKEVWYYGSTRSVVNKCFDKTDHHHSLQFTTVDFLISANEISDYEKFHIPDPVHVHKALCDFYQNLFLLANYLELKKYQYFWFSAADNSDCKIESFPALDRLPAVQWVKANNKIYQLHDFFIKKWARENDRDSRIDTGHLSELGHEKFSNFILAQL